MPVRVDDDEAALPVEREDAVEVEGNLLLKLLVVVASPRGEFHHPGDLVLNSKYLISRGQLDGDSQVHLADSPRFLLRCQRPLQLGRLLRRIVRASLGSLLPLDDAELCPLGRL